MRNRQIFKISKNMKLHFLKITILLGAFLLANAAVAQQDNFGWRLGAQGGIMSYNGDLTGQFRLIQPTPKTTHPFDHINFETYGFTAERSLSRAWGFGVSYSKGQFTANDRAIDWNGKLQTRNENFDRSLNALTKIKNYGAYFVYYFDNEKLLGKSAFLSPYLKAGVGVTRFKVYGDLYFGENNQPYFYWPDGTIRNLPEGDANAAVVGQDGKFETNLTELKTEGVNYRTSVFTPMAGLGLKFRLASRLNLNVEYLFHFTQTDYLDDVSGKFLPEYSSTAQEYAANPPNWKGEYRGNSNGKDDFYTFTTISLHYNLGRKKEAFAAPAILTGALPLWEMDTTAVLDTMEMETAGRPVDPTEAEMEADLKVKKVETAAPAIAPTEAEMEAELQKKPEQPAKAEQPTSPVAAPAAAENQQKIASLEKELTMLKARQDSLEGKVSQIVKAQMAGEIKRLEQEIEVLKTAPQPPKSPVQPAIAPMKPGDEMQDMQKELQDIKAQLQQRQQQLPKGPENAELTALRAKIQQYEQQLAAQNNRRNEAEMVALRASMESLRQEIAKPQPIVVTPPATDDGKDQQIAELNARTLQMQKTIDSLQARVVKPATPDTLAKPQIDPRLAALQAQMDTLQAKIKADEDRRKQEQAAVAKKLEDQRRQAEEQKRLEAEAQQQAELDAAKQELAELKAKEAAKAEADRKAKALADLKAKISAREQSVVYFNTGSSTLDERAKATVQDAAKLLLVHPELTATLEGFTDPSGNRQRNLELSRKRAEAVKEVLVQVGVPAERITVGEGGIDFKVKKPEEGRRVEVRLRVKE